MAEDEVQRRRVTALAVGALLAGFEWAASPNADRAVLVVDLTAGLAFFGLAVVAVGVPTGRRLATLGFAAGVSWFAGAFVPLAAGVWLGFLGHLLVASPTGRIERPVSKAIVAAGYAVAIALPQVGLVGIEAAWLGLVSAVALAGASRSSGPMRRGRLSAAVTAAFIAAAAAASAGGLVTGTLDVATARIVAAAGVGIGLLSLAVDLRWGGWSRDAVTRLVIDLGDRSPGATLRDRLAAVLDDPSLVIGYPLGDGSGHVDDDGHPVEPPSQGSGRVAVPLRAAGQFVGILVRDERSSIDPVLADGVAAAAALALRNARLHAATRRQVADLETSRERLIAAADAERRRIRRELDDGALRRLAGVRTALMRLAPGPERASLLDHVATVIGQLADLSNGLGPASALTEGLGPAVRTLAAASPVPAVAEAPDGRLPELVEATAFFVCSEGLANVAKHARASQVTILLREIAGDLRVEIIDDGVGGARAVAGSGLDGLRQRVETTGGRLAIEDRPEGGTLLRATLPVDRPAGVRLVRAPGGRRA